MFVCLVMFHANAVQMLYDCYHQRAAEEFRIESFITTESATNSRNVINFKYYRSVLQIWGDFLRRLSCELTQLRDWAVNLCPVNTLSRGRGQGCACSYCCLNFWEIKSSCVYENVQKCSEFRKMYGSFKEFCFNCLARVETLTGATHGSAIRGTVLEAVFKAFWPVTPRKLWLFENSL